MYQSVSSRRSYEKEEEVLRSVYGGEETKQGDREGAVRSSGDSVKQPRWLGVDIRHDT